MLPFLSLHALASQRGDGLRPELLALLQRQADRETGLSARIEPDDGTVLPCKVETQVSPHEQSDVNAV
jgi:hypothetical protein